MEETCQSNTLDWSSLVIFLFYFSLQQYFFQGFSVISQPISIKFGIPIVLDEETCMSYFQVNQSRGKGKGVVPKFYYAL